MLILCYKWGMPVAQLLWQNPPGPFPACVAFGPQQTLAETVQNHPVVPLGLRVTCPPPPAPTGFLLPDLWTEAHG